MVLSPRRLLSIGAITALTLIAAGCGGNQPPTGDPNEPAVGVSVVIDWSDASIPVGAASIGIVATPLEGKQSGSVEATIDSPASQVQMKVPVGVVRFVATAYTEAGARGTPLLSTAITVTLEENVANTVVIRFPDVASLARLVVSLNRSSLRAGEGTYATVKGFDSADLEIPNISVQWVSKKPSVASISSAGVIRALSVGTSIVTATEPISGLTGSATVTVLGAESTVTSVRLGPGSGSIPVGGSVSFQAQALDDEGNLIPGVRFSYVSNDPSVMGIDSNGKAVAVGIGTATVRATADGMSAEATLTVTPASSAQRGITWVMTNSVSTPIVYGFDVAEDGRMYAVHGSSSSQTGSGTPLFRSDDGGTTWQPVYSGDLNLLACSNPRQLTVAPNNSDRLFIVCSTGAATVLRSEDAGRTWARAYQSPNASSRPWFHPSNRDYVFAADGALTSTDGGRTWESTPVTGTRVVLDLNPRTWIDYTAQGAIAPRWTSDAGVSWTEITLPEVPVRGTPTCATEWQHARTAVSARGRIAFAAYQNCLSAPTGERYLEVVFTRNFADEEWSTSYYSVAGTGSSPFWGTSGTIRFGLVDDDYLYAVPYTTMGTAAANLLFASTDGGATWNERPFEAGGGAATSTLVMSTAVPGAMLVRASSSSNRTFLTYDNAITWQEVTLPLYRSVLDQERTSAYVYGDGSGGISRSSDFFTTLTRLPSAGLTGGINKVGIIPWHEPNALVLHASSYWTSATMERSSDRGATWSTLGTTSSLAIQAPSLSSRWYYATPKGDIRISNDNGASYTLAGRVPNLAVPSVFAVSFEDPAFLYALTANGLYRSRDGGATWAWASTNLSHVNNNDMVVDPTNHNTLYVGGYGVFKSANRGDDWTHHLTGLMNTDVRALAISSDGTTLYAGTWDGSIYRSLDAAVTWEWVNEGFESYTVQDIVIDPTDDNVISVSTTGGVYRSVDKGSSWTLASSGMFSPFATWLATSSDGETIYVGTEDHGIYRGTPSSVTGDSFTTHARQQLLEVMRLRSR